MTYFPTDVFQIILAYAGITGMTTEQIKLFNRVGVDTLLQLYNQTFQCNVLKLKSRTPALERRKIILKLLFSRFNRSNTFTNIYTLYFQEYKPVYDTSGIVLNTSYRILFSTNTPIIMGVISKINKKSVHIKPFAYSYEINENVWMYSYRVFDFNNFLKSKIIRLANVDSFKLINYFNRSDYSRETVSKRFIPEHEHHLIRYIS